MYHENINEEYIILMILFQVFFFHELLDSEAGVTKTLELVSQDWSEGARYWLISWTPLLPFGK